MMIPKIIINNSYCKAFNLSLKNSELVIDNCSIRQGYFVRAWNYKTGKRKVQMKFRTLHYASLNKGYVKFPRGWFWAIYDNLSLYYDNIEIIDERPEFKLVPINSKILLNEINFYNYQKDSINVSLNYRYGILSLPCGSGKTIISMGILDKIGIPGIIMVPSRLLLRQFQKEYEYYFPNLKIGIIGDNEFNIGDVTIGTSDSIFLKAKEIKKKLPQVKFLFLDEAHHIRETEKDFKNRYFDASLNIDASLKIGLTATPGSKKSLKRKLLEGVTGEILYHLSNEEAQKYNIITDAIVYILPVKNKKEKPDYLRSYSIRAEKENKEKLDYFEQHKIGLLENEEYHNLITQLAITSKNNDLSTLVIVNRVGDHLGVLEYKINKMELGGVEVLWGDTRKKAREEIIDRFSTGKNKLLISTIVKEGIDIKNIECIIMADGGRDADNLIQKIGRGLRASEGKNKLIIIDFMFSNGLLKDHSKDRLKVYKKRNYQVHNVNSMEEIKWRI